MPLPIIFAARLRRVLAEDQRRQPAPTEPLWRLLTGEIAELYWRVGLRRIGAVLLTVSVSVLLIEIVFSELTPGPVLSLGWRLVIAAVCACLALPIWAVRSAFARRGSSE